MKIGLLWKYKILFTRNLLRKVKRKNEKLIKYQSKELHSKHR